MRLERQRIGEDLVEFRIENVLKLESVERPVLEADEVRIRVLAVSAEHNIVHAALSDAVNIARAHGGKIYPGNSFIGEVLESGRSARRFKPGEIVGPSG